MYIIQLQQPEQLSYLPERHPLPVFENYARDVVQVE